MVNIRALEPDDIQPTVEFALRAWEPVFDSMANQVGSRLFRHLFGDDWRDYQAADIRRALLHTTCLSPRSQMTSSGMSPSTFPLPSHMARST